MKNRLLNNAWLFVFISLTWGIIMTTIGAVFFIGNILAGTVKELHIYKGRVCSTLSWSFGGISLGMFSFVDKDNDREYHKHELGHTIQHMILGPLFIIIVGLPSIIRAGLWSRLIMLAYKKGKTIDYDDIWFEGQATRLGEKYFKDIPFGE